MRYPDSRDGLILKVHLGSLRDDISFTRDTQMSHIVRPAQNTKSDFILISKKLYTGTFHFAP